MTGTWCEGFWKFRVVLQMRDKWLVSIENDETGVSRQRNSNAHSSSKGCSYPLKTWLLKPYTNRANLAAAQRVFNYRLSRARMTIESTFRRLKGRWRCLQKRLDVSVDFASTVVTACAIVHNLCEKRHERYMDEEGEEEHEERDDGDGEEAKPSAIILINDLATHFAITE